MDLSNTTGLPPSPGINVQETNIVTSPIITMTTSTITTVTSSTLPIMSPALQALPNVNTARQVSKMISDDKIAKIISNVLINESINFPSNEPNLITSSEPMDINTADIDKSNADKKFPEKSNKRGLSPSPELMHYKQPKKTFRIATEFKSRGFITKTTNRFEALSNAEDIPQNIPSAEQEILQAARNTGAIPRIKPTANSQNTDKLEREKESPKQAQTQPTTSNQQNKKSKIPPFVLTGFPNTHEELLQDLKQVAKGGFSIKYGANSTLIYTNEITDYHRVKNALDEAKHQFHTYTDPDNLQHAFVLRGLDAIVNINDVKEELTDMYNLNVLQIYKMKTLRRPLYLVITDQNVTLNYLNNNVRCALNIKITWERRRNERILAQCRRCQLWGHSAANCRRDPRCVKCAANHMTYTCIKTRETPATCANCQGDHPACSVRCPVYIKKLEAIQKNNSSKNPQQPLYKPAPHPVTNVWTARSQQRQQQPSTPGPSTSTSKTPTTRIVH